MRVLRQIIEDIVIVELYNPVYDVDKKILKYDVIPDNATSIELPSEFGKTSMIMDPIRNRSTDLWTGT
jgi:hypothetical protein